MSKHLPLAALLACIALAGCGDTPGGQAVTGPSELPASMMAPIDELSPGDGGYGEGGEEIGGGTGGTTVPPFNPPFRPYIFAANLAPAPLTSSLYYECGQVTHAFWGFSNDVTQGTVIYLTGVVAPGTVMHWGIYNQAGQLVREHWTQKSRDNCVVHHEPEGVSTAGMAPGYYYLYASYVQLANIYAQETWAGHQQSTVGKFVGPLRVR